MSRDLDGYDRRNPFQGGMGFFTPRGPDRGHGRDSALVAIPFRVGWGFSLVKVSEEIRFPH